MGGKCVGFSRCSHDNTTQTSAFLTDGETVTGRDEYKSQVEQPGRHLPMLCAPILLGEGTAEGVREGGEEKLAGF